MLNLAQATEVMLNRIGVCSWSLRPDSPDDLVEKVLACGLSAVQLALDPIRRTQWDEQETFTLLRKANINILSGMMAMKGEDYSTLQSIRDTGGVRADEHWADNLAAAQANAELAQRNRIDLVTLHAGFLPESAGDPLRSDMIDRLRQIADVFSAAGINIAFETGQESAATLLDALQAIDRPSLGVNFDPANMILYGMGDPIASLRMLCDRVRQIHIKDANAATDPGQWGTEMRVGKGSVDWPAFMAIVRERLADINLIIEREHGRTTITDIRAAHSLIRKLLKSGRSS